MYSSTERQREGKKRGREREERAEKERTENKERWQLGMVTVNMYKVNVYLVQSASRDSGRTNYNSITKRESQKETQT